MRANLTEVVALVELLKSFRKQEWLKTTKIEIGDNRYKLEEATKDCLVWKSFLSFLENKVTSRNHMCFLRSRSSCLIAADLFDLVSFVVVDWECCYLPWMAR